MKILSPALWCVLTLVSIAGGHFLQKRSFAGLGCMGVYDKAKFARLEQVCEDCFQLYRRNDVHRFCRENCFKNDYFTKCVDLLLHDQQTYNEVVDEIYGKR